MPKVTKTTARKDAPKACPQAKAGQVYYWWRTRMKGARSGVTRCSLTYPRPSQLTMSDFWGQVYSLQEEIQDYVPETREDLDSMQSEWASQARDIGSEQRDKLGNMPENLQQGDTGQMLEERAEACDDWGDEIEAVSLPEESDLEFEDDDGDLDEDAFNEALNEAVQEMAGLGPECS